MKRILSFLLCVVLLLGSPPVARAAGTANGFTEVNVQTTADGVFHLFRHAASGAQVVWRESEDEMRTFAVGFRTPPADSKGANHVLEHALLNGSEKYPVRTLMHQLESTSAADLINAYTADDYTMYIACTRNETDFYNLADVLLDSVLHPLLLTDPNIFLQQGVRVEYADGRAQYNGIVYTELRLRSLDTAENALSRLNAQLYQNLYGDSGPSLDAGGTVQDIVNLTYDDLLRVYRTCYIPSNMVIYVEGKQDIGRTLTLLNRVLPDSGADAAPVPPPSARAAAQTEVVQRVGVTAETKTVDIGFLCEGPAVADKRESLAWSMLSEAVADALREAFPEADGYVTGGSGRGVTNVGPILSGVPAGQADAAVEAFRSILRAIAEEGLSDEQRTAHAAVYEGLYANPLYRARAVYDGYAYADDPLSQLDLAAVSTSLAEDGALFRTLAQRWLDSDLQTIVIYGGGAQPALPVPQGVDLEQVKRDTEAFTSWVSTPDSAKALATLPSLDLADFKDDPFTAFPVHTATGEADWYWTESGEDCAFSLYFPISPARDNLPLWCLLAEYLNAQSESVYCSLSPTARADDPDVLLPHFVISGSDAAPDLSTVRNSAAVTDPAALRAFLTDRSRELRQIFLDPYASEYSLRLQTGSQNERFTDAVPAGFVNSSPSYRAFIDDAATHPARDKALLAELRGLLDGALRSGGVAVEFTGTREDFDTFQKAAAAFLRALPADGSPARCPYLPGGWPSGLVVTSGEQSAGHALLSLPLPDADPAVMQVLCKVLTAKYLRPELRDRRGSYGAGAHFSDGILTCSVSGAVPLDEIRAVFAGMGDWLRGLTLSPAERTGFRISALNEFDEYNEWTRSSGAAVAIGGRTQADFTHERNRICAVTMNDLRACADLLDDFAAHGHFYAYANRDAAARTAYPFACRIDMADGRLIPMLRDDLAVSGDQTALTRAQAAALLAESLLNPGQLERPQESRFPDVAPDSPEATSIALLADRGLLRGCGDGGYHPDEPMSMGAFCALAARLLPGSESANGRYTGHWAAGAMNRLRAASCLDGSPAPDAPVTRAAATAILQKIAALQ